MFESRRRMIGVLGVLAGAAATEIAPGLLAQNHSSQEPRHHPIPNLPKPDRSSPDLDDPPVKKTPAPGEQNRQLQADLRTEVDKLCAMANELKEDMLRVNPSETLSVGFIKKVQTIEKLAKHIKDQARG